MDRFKATIEFVKSQLSRLQPIHKTLIGSALVVALMALLLVREYAGQREFLPLGIDQANQAQAINHLRNAGIQYQETTEGLLVEAGRRSEATVLLSENRVLGTDASALLFDLLKEQPWWANRQQNQQTLNAARSRVLGEVLSKWSCIRTAEVLVSVPLERPGLGRPPIPPTASVGVHPARGPLTQEQVEAIADFVSGSIPNLSRDQVRIVDRDAGATLRVRSQSRMSASNYMELLAKVETYYEDKIRRTLPEIPKVVVTVNAIVDNAPKTTSEVSYAREGAGSQSFLKEQRTFDQEHGNQIQGGVPGDPAQTGTTSAMGIGGSSSDTNERTTSSEETLTFEPKAGVRETQEQDPGGKPTRINATIRIPKSFISRIWHAQNPDATDEPNDTQLQLLFAEQRSQLEEQIGNLIDTTEPYSDPAQGAAAIASQAAVMVGMYYDFDASIFGGGTADTAASGVGTWLVSADGTIAGMEVRDIMLGGFTLMSLFLLFRIVRGATVRRDLPSAEELVGIPPSLRSETEDLIGEADVSEPPMDALEVDDDEIRAQKLVEQVEELVGTNPAETSKILGRWAIPD
ncbi:MAG: hypothetical protein ACOC0P_06905 [Planctomycetota bacterium]